MWDPARASAVVGGGTNDSDRGPSVQGALGGSASAARTRAQVQLRCMAAVQSFTDRGG